jgi:aspartyl-tRNA(Asn)/glutamyl-tRNA(Gln) amidotransferase subunit B
VNEEILGKVVQIALALSCKVVTNEPIYVRRKHYFWPDLPSGYQRTSLPVAIDGELAGVRIRECHLEEDPGRYDLRTGEVDYNRSGIPLVEIVTDPDFTSPEHARQFLEELGAILEYLNAARVEPGSTRVDANISIEGHPRIEVKNINSFKGVVTALSFEETRQRNLVKHGVTYGQETRHFDEGRGITIGLRRKETADDYRYFPDPDIPPLIVTPAMVEKLAKQMPELPRQKRARLAKQYGITAEEAYAICLEQEYADAFEKIAKKTDAKIAARLMRGMLKKQLNWRNRSFKQSKLTPELLCELLQMLSTSEVTEKVGEQLLIEFLDHGRAPRANAQKQGLLGVHGGDELLAVVEKVIAANPKPAADFASGKPEALHFLAGLVMRETKGMASPTQAQEMLRKALAKK